MNKEMKALIIASGCVLTEQLTEELLNGDEIELDEFIEEHAWQPFEHWEANNIWTHMQEIADLILQGVSDE